MTTSQWLETGQPGGRIRIGYQRYAGLRTRVLEVGPGESEAAMPRAGLLRRARPGAAQQRHRQHRQQQRKRPRFVLLHGYCDNADTWRLVLGKLAAAGHSAIAVDLPGFGAADALRPGQILPQHDAFLAAVIREQAVRGNVVLVGNSLGGTVSLRAAHHDSAQVSGVVSIASPGFADSWLVRGVARNPLPLRLYASLPLPVPGPVVRKVASAVIPRLIYADASAADGADTERFLAQLADYPATRQRLEQARQLVSEIDNAYLPERITAPLLAVGCGKDRLVSPAGARRLHTLVPHSRLLIKPDWGHCPQLDAPDEVSQLVSYFAASCRNDAAQASPRTSRPTPTGTAPPGTAAG
ncbi:alpha/beta hydrolase [Haloechinothrix sp. LS1_15]|uniref:alpha/beta fold hydrolase n=1 Tax=Haloechinothrix sp. LS1_15 TaxID=2652248 RepID=UPI002946FFF5|nr:alpha/beta hydrolase [Haloechinothrix sp. LS1_15]MDV6012067.1 alpha/beta hydrolase [Haloechinothrix sp. LS1_15]